MIYNLLLDFKNDVNCRFDQVDKRFQQIDKRFDRSEKRLENLEEYVREIHKYHKNITVKFTIQWAMASLVIALGSGMFLVMMTNIL